MKHCMIDLETLGINTNAVFLSIAAIPFDIDTGEITQPFYETIDINSAMDTGLVVEGETLLWWLKQKPEVMAKMFYKPSHIAYILTRFGNWFKDNKIEYPWGNSAWFDLGKLIYAYNLLNLEIPWDTKKNMCYSTIKKLFPSISVDPVEGEAHDPIVDCKRQINHLVKIWKHTNPLNLVAATNPNEVASSISKWLSDNGYKYEIIGENFTATTYSTPLNRS